MASLTYISRSQYLCLPYNGYFVGSLSGFCLICFFMPSWASPIFTTFTSTLEKKSLPRTYMLLIQYQCTDKIILNNSLNSY